METVQDRSGGKNRESMCSHNQPREIPNPPSFVDDGLLQGFEGVLKKMDVFFARCAKLEESLRALRRTEGWRDVGGGC